MTEIKNKRDWLDSRITALKEAANSDNFSTLIEKNDISNARSLIGTNAYSSPHFFVILTAINLLNTAIKQLDHKSELDYSFIKGNVSRVLHYLISLNQHNYELTFFIDPKEKCAYIQIYNLQFSFHNININETISAFINSDRNKSMHWKGIRLQKIAGELFRTAMEYREMNEES